MNKILTNIVWWIGLLLLQFVLVFYFRVTLVYTPYIYLLLLFTLPKSLSTIESLLLAFITGLCIDIFTNSWGIHAFSAVFVIFIFKTFANTFAQTQLSNEETNFSIKSMGAFQYSFVLFSLFLIYHLIVIFLWNFSFDLLIHNITKAFFSALIASFITFFLLSLSKTRKEEENG